MSNQDLSYEALTDLAERVAMGLQNRNQPLDELSQALQSLTNTNSIKGYAASRMKAYINETHLTLIQSLQLALTNYQMALGQYVEGYLQVDDSHHFHLVHEDLAELQQKLQNQKGHYQDIAHALSSIASEASGIIDLNGAGSHQMKRVVTSMEDMQHTAQHLWEEWQQYEEHDPGFDQITDLIQQTRQLIQQTLQVPRGYDYQPGSFSQLMSDDFLQAIQANSAYASNADNQKQFTKTWQNIAKDYQKAQEKLAEAKAKKKAKEAGLWGLVTDVLQTVAGAVISAAGLGLAPFSGGFSLGLVALGGTMVVGGVNSTINHASMAISGQGYNLVGQLSQGVGKFYNHTLGKSLGQKGIGGFTNGLLAGAGDFVSSSAQFNVVDTAKGIYTLATNHQAQAQFGHELGTMFNQLKGGNVYVAGQATATALTFFTGGAEAKVGKLSEATNLVTKLGRAKNLLLTKGSNLLERSEGKIQQLKNLFQDNPRVAFSGASEPTSLLKQEFRQAKEAAQNSVQRSLTKETKEANKFDDLGKISPEYRGVASAEDVTKVVKIEEGHFTEKSIDDLADLASHNKEASTTTLGKWHPDGTSYEQIAYEKGNAYYDLGNDGWNEAEQSLRKLGISDREDIFDEMWKINQKYLDNRIDNGDVFEFTSNPNEFLPGSYGYEESHYLEKNGYHLVQDNGQWRMIK